MKMSEQTRLEIKANVFKILRAADKKDSPKAVKKRIFESNPELTNELLAEILLEIPHE